MIKVKLVEYQAKKCLWLHENDCIAFSKCCEIVEQIFASVIKDIERLHVKAALSDMDITYYLEDGSVDIHLDEAWGIDIFCSPDHVLASLQDAMDSSHHFAICT